MHQSSTVLYDVHNTVSLYCIAGSLCLVRTQVDLDTRAPFARERRQQRRTRRMLN